MSSLVRFDVFSLILLPFVFTLGLASSIMSVSSFGGGYLHAFQQNHKGFPLIYCNTMHCSPSHYFELLPYNIFLYALQLVLVQIYSGTSFILILYKVSGLESIPVTTLPPGQITASTA